MSAPLCTSTMPVTRVETRGTFDTLLAALRGLRTALIIRKQRLALLRLDAVMLADIGLSEDEAAIEAARPLWDVPGTWRRNG